MPTHVLAANRLHARPTWPLLVGLAGLLAVGLVLSLGIGAVTIAPGQVLAVLWAKARRPAAASAEITIIIWDLRLARALLAIVIGAGLAAAGAAYQAVFRNPLANPFVIGASGGAALGATVAIVTGLPP
ncbi:MAG: iron chelate uptake ABC transporter family permease subunit, partial [Anaerolineae bacterium]